MKLINESKLRKLLVDSECLRRLEAGGVDNWCWYGKALNEDGDWCDFEDDEVNQILANYPDYTVTELDNYNFE